MACLSVLSQHVCEVTVENQGNHHNKGSWRDFNKEFHKYKGVCPLRCDALWVPVLPVFSGSVAVSSEMVVPLYQQLCDITVM